MVYDRYMSDPSPLGGTTFQAAIDTAREGVLCVDGDGRFPYANARVSSWLGYAPDELRALRIWEVDVGTSEALWPAVWRRPTSEGVTETSYRRKDGRLIPVEVSANDLDVRGRRLRVAFIRDATERRAIIDSLRRTQEGVDKARDPIFWVRADGSFAYANDAACELLEYTREEILRLGMPDISPSATPWDERWRRRREEGSLRFERVHRSKSGRDVPVEVSISVVQFQGEEYHCVYTRDISERKRAEAEKARLEMQLLHARKLESVGRLAGGVAHDFNNMLSVILGYTELITAKLAPGDPLLEPLGEIRKAAFHSRDTTRQLLAFSRKQVIAPRTVDLNELVRSAQNSLLRLIGEDIELSFMPGDGLWSVEFDPSQVEQALVNLIVNARDALPEGGRITVETSNIQLDPAYCRDHLELQPGDYVVLSVSDDGVGMDEETLSHIFEPFFSTKEVGKGTGLGLATVYGVMKQNNGFITVTSGAGRGTTFRLYIPSTKGPAVGAAPPVEDFAARGHGTILLVEDNQMVRNLTRSMLEALGYTVLSAESAEAALSLCENPNQRVDLLLSDVVMPDMRGPALRERSCAIRPGLEVLFMSGHAPSLVAGENPAGAPLRFIQKPFTMPELARSVESALRRTPPRTNGREG
jgi:two-component system, cell cycle sensor histidine kinase and response regulator CckA